MLDTARAKDIGAFNASLRRGLARELIARRRRKTTNSGERMPRTLLPGVVRV